jgi:SAM-dependent methyltransferase
MASQSSTLGATRIDPNYNFPVRYGTSDKTTAPAAAPPNGGPQSIPAIGARALNPFLSQGSYNHLRKIRDFYNSAELDSGWAGRRYRKLLAHYYRLLIPSDASIIEIGCGSGELLAHFPNRKIAGLDLSERQIEKARERIPHGDFYTQAAELLDINDTFDFIILSDTINLAADAQAMLGRLQSISHSRTRLLLNYHNNLWRPILGLAKKLGLHSQGVAFNWFSPADVRNLLRLSDWEELKVQPRILMPAPLFGLDVIANRYLAPLLPWFCLAAFTIARPRAHNRWGNHSVSVVIPARNEAGNIAEAVQRMPKLGTGTEIIFIEGHSRDHTCEEIQRVARETPRMPIRCLCQTGEGKGNAVREAFEAAAGDILIILDADLTVSPEELPKFYEALASGKADFANGVRLVYPIEEQAMQFFNLCGNKFFSIVFTWLLQQPVKDTLCGTKALFRHDYQRIAANREVFGDFDPFGDFDLLFGADKLHLKIVDVPIRYQKRTYGQTNIQRWLHGVILFKMVAFAARKLKFI